MCLSKIFHWISCLYNATKIRKKQKNSYVGTLKSSIVVEFILMYMIQVYGLISSITICVDVLLMSLYVTSFFISCRVCVGENCNSGCFWLQYRTLHILLRDKWNTTRNIHVKYVLESRLDPHSSLSLNACS